MSTRCKNRLMIKQYLSNGIFCGTLATCLVQLAISKCGGILRFFFELVRAGENMLVKKNKPVVVCSLMYVPLLCDECVEEKNKIAGTSS